MVQAVLFFTSLFLRSSMPLSTSSTRRCPVLWRLWSTAVFLFGLSPWHCYGAANDVNNDVSFHDDDKLSSSRNGTRHVMNSSIIYTYFEHIPANIRTSGMDDDADRQLLEFWKESWASAGWNPIILGIQDVKQLEHYAAVEAKLVHELRLDPWSRVLYHRWMAMAAMGGGWYVDYDVFPLMPASSFSSNDDFHPRTIDLLPNNGRMTVHDIHSPTLASGTGEQWLLTLQALLEDAKQNAISPIAQHGAVSTFWTDSLGINNLVKQYGTQSPAPLTGKRAIVPYTSGNDPIVTRNPEDCGGRPFRNRWVVHMSPKVFQTAQHLLPGERHPKYRQKEIEKWLQGWKEVCHQTEQSLLNETKLQ